MILFFTTFWIGHPPFHSTLGSTYYLADLLQMTISQINFWLQLHIKTTEELPSQAILQFPTQKLWDKKIKWLFQYKVKLCFIILQKKPEQHLSQDDSLFLLMCLSKHIVPFKINHTCAILGVTSLPHYFLNLFKHLLNAWTCKFYLAWKTREKLQRLNSCNLGIGSVRFTSIQTCIIFCFLKWRWWVFKREWFFSWTRKLSQCKLWLQESMSI